MCACVNECGDFVWFDTAALCCMHFFFVFFFCLKCPALFCFSTETGFLPALGCKVIYALHVALFFKLDSDMLDVDALT